MLLGFNSVFYPPVDPNAFESYVTYINKEFKHFSKKSKYTFPLSLPQSDKNNLSQNTKPVCYLFIYFFSKM